MKSYQAVYRRNITKSIDETPSQFCTRKRSIPEVKTLVIDADHIAQAREIAMGKTTKDYILDDVQHYLCSPSPDEIAGPDYKDPQEQPELCSGVAVDSGKPFLFRDAQHPFNKPVAYDTKEETQLPITKLAAAEVNDFSGLPDAAYCASLRKFGLVKPLRVSPLLNLLDGKKRAHAIHFMWKQECEYAEKAGKPTPSEPTVKVEILRIVDGATRARIQQDMLVGTAR